MNINYSLQSDVVEIEGIRYAGEVFRQVGSFLPIGRYFKLMQREDGVVTIYTPPPIDPGLRIAIEKASETGETVIEHAGRLVFINRGEQPGDTTHIDCPACAGSGHKDDAGLTAQDIAMLHWIKAHRASYYKEFERIQRRDAKKVAVPDEV